ncbi:MAG: hypothetical protein JWO95_2594 [Verrucomicrobiales bacterium]|nr:hypothetical protein [Verrucomicrobiales bacterium]
MRLFHAEGQLRALRRYVLGFDIKANAANISDPFGVGHDVCVERFENALTARGFVDINAL